MTHASLIARPLLLLLATAIAIFSAVAAANASDGTLEINQACAGTGCFPGDAPGFPVTLTSSGSYRLTSSLIQTIFGLGGSPPVNAIEIEASYVQIDLGGFLIACRESLGGECSGSASGIAATGGTLQDPIEHITVQNGFVSGMPNYGVSLGAGGAVVRNVSVVNNGANGILAGSALVSGSLVEGSIARNNGGTGIRVGFDGLIRGSVSTGNSSFAVAGTVIFGGSSGSGYTECVVEGATELITDLGSNN